MEEKYSLTCPDGPAIAPVLWAMFLTTQVMAASWPSATTSGVVRLSTKLGTEKNKRQIETFSFIQPKFSFISFTFTNQNLGLFKTFHWNWNI